MAIGRLVPAGRAETVPAATNRLIVTNLDELYRSATENNGQLVSLRIEGTVRWSGKAEGRILFSDETATRLLELNLPCQMPAAGDRLLLEGDCLAAWMDDTIKLSGVPVVDHDGIHGMEAKASATVFLEKGHHAIRADWFDRTGGFGLEVHLAGPDMPRQKIPDNMLFLRPPDPATAENGPNGLHYRCSEGRAWKNIPNLDHITAVKTGIAQNFDISERSRDNHVALSFNGFIAIPKDGSYTFDIQSDDGSRLYIGGPSLRIQQPEQENRPRTGSTPEVALNNGPEFEWSKIKGTVSSFHRSGGTLELDIMSVMGPVTLHIAEDSDSSYTLMRRNRIQAAGLARRIRTLHPGSIRRELFVQRWEDVEQENITPDIWTEYPLIEIGSLTALNPTGIVDAVVRLRGKVISQGAGQPMQLEDGSGSIELEDTVPETPPGELSDVIARVAMKGSNLILRYTHIRQQRAQPEATGAEISQLPVLTSVARICQLSNEEAERRYPVSIRGVITSIKDYAGGFEGAVIQDATGGIYVDLNTQGYPVRLQLGEYVEIEGETAPFLFQPDVKLKRLQRLGTGALPVPVRPTWDQLINGSLHCNYVELEGVVTSIKDEYLTLLTRDGRINIRLNPTGADIPPDALRATVRLRGCLYATWDKTTGKIQVGNIRLYQHKITVIKAAPVDPFAIPLKQISDLLQFDPEAGALRRVKVSGILVYQDTEISCLVNGDNGLFYLPSDAGDSQIGDRLEMVGFMDIIGPSPLLRDVLVRRLEHAGLPKPRRVDDRALLSAEHHAALVQVKGTLEGFRTRPHETVFDIQNGRHHFIAVAGDLSGMDRMPKPGSILELTGVYVWQEGAREPDQPINSFKLLLNSGHDVRVVSRPPWWTPRRLLLVVALLISGLFSALVWVNLLHRKVEQRTEQLGSQIRRREIEQERTRVAQDLHDDLGGGLTEVNMLVSLIQSPAATSEEKARYVSELDKLALRMVASLDEIVWAINPRNDSITSLADYFVLYTQRLAELASLSLRLDVAENLPDQPLAPRFRQEMFLAFKEALINVVQHANARKLEVRISVQGDEMVVIVSDDGCGIMPGKLEAGADGLANMRQRMDLLGGTCEIESEQNKGTIVRLQAAIHRMQK
jgi:signal transduction histidine kinase